MAKPLSRKAALAMGALAVYLNPKMAQDATIDLGAILKNVTAKNWKAQKPKLADRLNKAADGKLAQDADLEDVIEMLDQLDDVTDEVADVIEAPAEERPEEPAKDDDGDLMDRLREFLAGKLSDEDMAALETMMKPEVKPEGMPATDEPPPFVKKEEDKKDDKKEDDKVSKQAMDAALEAHGKKVEAATMLRLGAIRDAEREVRPWIGDLVIAQDSALDIYRLALDTLGVDAKGISDIKALQLVLNNLPKPGEVRSARQPAMDAAGAKSYAERFPNANRLKN